MKMYFEKFEFDDYPESCYPKSHFIEEMKERGIDQITVYPAKMLKGEEYAWCTEFQDMVEVKQGDCGRFCEKYSPRNGKNGRCRFSANTYEPDTDNPIVLTL